MKKLFALLLAIAMLACLLAACGDDKEGADGGNDQPAEIQGEVFDAGNVKAMVPEGWKAFPAIDAFAEEEGATDPDVINICKGAETDLDIFSKPYIRVDFYGADTEMMGGLREFYENTEDLASIELGTHKWEGFTTTDYGLMAILVSDEGELEYQVSIYMEATSGKISLEDADVLYILEHIAASAG